MYETKINIFPKGFKKRFLGKFFCVFSKKIIKLIKNIFLKIQCVPKIFEWFCSIVEDTLCIAEKSLMASPTLRTKT